MCGGSRTDLYSTTDQSIGADRQPGNLQRFCGCARAGAGEVSVVLQAESNFRSHHTDLVDFSRGTASARRILLPRQNDWGKNIERSRLPDNDTSQLTPATRTPPARPH